MTISLAFLAPELTKAVVEGTLASGVTLSRLYDPSSTWRGQFTKIGLTPENK